uniref:Uncharacterized protein n=1 Tax=Lepeophtheirus salmonis TaxID=72036 RepID=A0A0K2V2C2_LEPSM
MDLVKVSRFMFLN